MKNEIKAYVDIAREDGIEVAFREIETETKGEIADLLSEGTNDNELFSFIHDYIDDTLCKMEDFDDVCSYMTPTEILESCGDIDLSDEFFNSDTLESSNDIYDLLEHLSEEELIDRIYDEYTCNGSGSYIRELNDIMKYEEALKEQVEAEYKSYENAKKLFDMAMNNDPQAVISALWNMNN